VTGALNMNYWGYSTVGFFAPKAGYAATGAAGMQADEFKTMVRALHAAGIEVLLDVVFNHTCEGDHRGPSISFRGLDNKTYYMLTPEGYYHNFSGCGNSLNCNNPVVREMVLECLRYWVSEFHIDGFRFDAAAILGRDLRRADAHPSPAGIRRIRPRPEKMQAHRRGLGCGRPLPPRQLPELQQVRRMERKVPRRGPRFSPWPVHLRRAHPVLRLPRHPRSDGPGALGFQEISWHGRQPWQPDWDSLLVAAVFAADFPDGPDVVFYAWNTGWDSEVITLPPAPAGFRWAVLANTGGPSPEDVFAQASGPALTPGEAFLLGPRSSAVLFAKKYL